MKLTFSQIREMTWGVARIQEEDGNLCFYRCTEEQEALFKRRKDEFYRHSLGTAGIRLVFQTDSQHLVMKVKVDAVTDRKRFSFDVFVNDELIGYLDNFSDVELPAGEKRVELPTGEFEKTFELGEGEKVVCIHFPYSAKGMVRSIELDDGSSVEAVKSKRKLLAYGDSITQGYYALRSSNRYIAKLADLLEAEEVNKAIGSDRFCPGLANLTDEFTPEYIVVAHGTNDWRTNRTREQFRENCGSFIHTIREKYPEAKIIAISPIWRKDYTDERPFGDFTKIDEDLRTVVSDMENVIVIRGFDLVPHEEAYFGDLQLHPNDKGFQEYFKNLKEMIEGA